MQRADVIAELQRVARLLDTDCLSRSAFKEHATISSGVVEATFGTWNEAIHAAGLTPLPQGGIPKNEQRRLARVAEPATAGSPYRIADDELLKDLIRLANELGRRPSGNQISAKGKFDPKVYKNRWGSVAAAYEVATQHFPEPESTRLA